MSDIPKAAESQTQTLQFHYIKSNYFRVIHVDGAVAGIGPGSLFFSLYSERLPIPQVQVFQITPDQNVGNELTDQRVTRPGVVREVEVGISMNVETAKAFRELLDRHIQAVQMAFQKKSVSSE